MHRHFGQRFQIFSSWDNNSDSALDIDKVNSNDYYKDKIRTWELKARIMKNGGKAE